MSAEATVGWFTIGGAAVAGIIDLFSRKMDRSAAETARRGDRTAARNERWQDKGAAALGQMMLY